MIECTTMDTKARTKLTTAPIGLITSIGLSMNASTETISKEASGYSSRVESAASN
jgi:hypothetical protein